MFGGGVTSPAPGAASTGSMFGSTASQPTGTTGLFGSTSQPSGGTGLFGSTTAQPTGTGLFGSTTSQPTGTGLFGSGGSATSTGGFSFPTAAQPSTGGGGLFGSTAASTAAPTGGFTFPSAQPMSTGTSTLFGTSTTGTSQPQSASTLFGTSTTGNVQPTSTLFGTGASAPATSNAGTLGTGAFSFPSTTATQPATGGGFSFGSTTAPVATGGFSFGAAATPASAATAQPTSTLFGTGTGTTTTGTGFSIPTATATSISQPQAGSGSTLFGAGGASAPAATSTGFSFGATSAASAPVTSTATTGISFGAQPITSQSQPTSAFSTTATSSAPAAETNTGFGLGGTTTITTMPSTGFTFGALPKTTASTTTTPAAAIAPLGASATTSASSSVTPIKLTFGATPTTVAATTQAAAVQPQAQTHPVGFTGLGGIQPPVVNSDPSQVLATGGGTVGGIVRPEERTLQDQPLPVELIELVDGLKDHITAGKNGISELASTVGRSIEKVSETCESIRQQLSSTSTLIHRQILECEALDAQLEKDKKDANMTLVVLNTPPALQAEQRAPYNYLFGILASYQEKIAMYKREILKAETVLKSSDSAKLFSPGELNLALQSTKDSVILLAAKVKVLHDKAVTEVESHRNLLRYAKGSGTSIGRAMLADKGRSAPAHVLPRHTGPPTALGLGLGAHKTLAYLSKANNNLFPSRHPKTTASKAYGDFLGSTIKPPSSAQRIFHSTQLPVPMATGMSFNSSGFGQSLFQSPSSPIFPSDLNTPGGGSSLKRSKH